MRAKATKRILILVDHPTLTVKEVLAGVVQDRGAWIFRWEYDQEDELDEAFNWRPDGLVVVSNNGRQGRRFPFGNIPVVSIGPDASSASWPHLTIDHTAIGDLAAKYLWQKGFYHFLTILNPGCAMQAQRALGFQSYLQARPTASSVLSVSPKLGAQPCTQADEDLYGVLARLPKPLGVFAASDQIGFAVCEFCRDHKLRVPEDIAVISAGDHNEMAELSVPSLSTISIPWRKMGIEACRLLDQQFKNQTLNGELRMIKPTETHTRGSTDFFSVNDPDLAAAIAYIRQNLSKSITINQLAKKVSLSRRLLELRFREHLRKTPMDFIRTARLHRARELLLSTDNSIGRIAHACGFSSTTHFGVAFRREYDLSPSEFRSAHRNKS